MQMPSRLRGADDAPERAASHPEGDAHGATAAVGSIRGAARAARSIPDLLNGRRVFVALTLTPAVVLLIAYVIGPVVYSFYLSLFDTHFLTPVKFVGFQQYNIVFHDSVFWSAVRNTLYYTVGSVVGTLVLGLAAALALRSSLPGRGLYRTVFFLPYVVPYAAFALLWYWLYDPQYGFVNYLLREVHIGAVPWLQTSRWVIPAFIIMSIWKHLGFAVVLFLAGLQTIPAEMYDAASVDGAGSWARFRRITLPLLTPITVFVTIVSISGGLQLFVEPQVMTDGGPGYSSTSIAQLLYQEAFSSGNFGRASAIAIDLFVIIFGFALLLLRRFDVKELYG